MNKKNNRKGFTIVELVIVIAVIGILATVLVPTFGNVIADAKQKAAMQEAKNLYTQYVAETAETAVPVDEVYYQDGDIVVKVTNGNVSVETSLPATNTCYYSISNTAAVTHVPNGTTTCAHVSAGG